MFHPKSNKVVKKSSSSSRSSKRSKAISFIKDYLTGFFDLKKSQNISSPPPPAVEDIVDVISSIFLETSPAPSPPPPQQQQQPLFEEIDLTDDSEEMEEKIPSSSPSPLPPIEYILDAINFLSIDSPPLSPLQSPPQQQQQYQQEQQLPVSTPPKQVFEIDLTDLVDLDPKELDIYLPPTVLKRDATTMTWEPACCHPEGYMMRRKFYVKKKDADEQQQQKMMMEM